MSGRGEGLGFLIVLFEEAVDRGLQVGDRSKDAALEPAFREGREEAFDRVEPGSRCWCEMERPSRMTFEPSTNIGMLMGGVVVADRVDRLAGWNLALDGVGKADKVLMPVALPVAADHRAVEDVHRGKQRRRAVPLIDGGSWFRRGPSSAAVRAE